MLAHQRLRFPIIQSKPMTLKADFSDAQAVIPGKGLAGNGENLREVFKQFEPLHRDLARVQGAIAERRHNMRSLIHNYASLVDELSNKDHDLRRLVESSNATFKQFAVEDKNIST